MDKYVGKRLDGRYEIKEIIGMGGIRTAQDALEMLMAGACAVSVGTASFHDQRAALSIIDGIRSYLERHQIPDIKEIIGCV